MTGVQVRVVAKDEAEIIRRKRNRSLYPCTTTKGWSRVEKSACEPAGFGLR